MHVLELSTFFRLKTLLLNKLSAVGKLSTGKILVIQADLMQKENLIQKSAIHGISFKKTDLCFKGKVLNLDSKLQTPTSILCVSLCLLCATLCSAFPVEQSNQTK